MTAQCAVRAANSLCPQAKSNLSFSAKCLGFVKSGAFFCPFKTDLGYFEGGLGYIQYFAKVQIIVKNILLYGKIFCYCIAGCIAEKQLLHKKMRNIHKVVTTLRYSPEQMAQVRSFFPEAAFVQVDRSDTVTLLRELRDADVALMSGDLDDRFLGDNQLQWIHCDHAGLARSAKPALFERGILLSGAAGRSSPVLAEHAIYFMLAACYHTRELLHAQDSHQWGVADQSAWRGLYGRTAGLVGMGNNGKMLATRLRVCIR